MQDWIGAAFILILVAGALFGLRSLGRPRKSTEADFEKRASESASLLGAGVSALQGILDPADKKARESVREQEEGVYRKVSGDDETLGGAVGRGGDQN